MCYSAVYCLCVNMKGKKNKLDEVTATYEKVWEKRCVKAFLGDAQSACWEKQRKIHDRNGGYC